MEQGYRENLKEFFTETKNNPWGELVAVQCKPMDLEKHCDKNIHETLINVLRTEDWQTETSDSWSNRNSGSDIFYIFKVHELWKSIKQYGTKSPVHIHNEAGYNNFYFHPSNNKIEVLVEFFPNIDITVLYHNYSFLKEQYDVPELEWYKKYSHKIINTEQEYLDLYNLDKNDNDLELLFGWEYISNICNNDKIWGKLKPKVRDWRSVDHIKYKDDLLYKNSLFLTVTDRYHRVAMQKNKKMLKDIIQVSPGKAKYCGKVFDIDE